LRNSHESAKSSLHKPQYLVLSPRRAIHIFSILKESVYDIPVAAFINISGCGTAMSASLSSKLSSLYDYQTSGEDHPGLPQYMLLELSVVVLGMWMK
jgi:hypothetical protein